MSKKAEKNCELCEKFLQAGQICSACNRSYIHFKCAENFAKYVRINDKKYLACKTCLPIFPILDPIFDSLEESCPAGNESKATHLQETEKIQELNITQPQQINNLEKSPETIETHTTTCKEQPNRTQVPEVIHNIPNQQIVPKVSIHNQNSSKYVEYDSRKFTLLQSGYPKLVFHKLHPTYCPADTILFTSSIEPTEHSIFRLLRIVKRYDKSLWEGYYIDVLIECDQKIFDIFMEKRDILRPEFKIFESIQTVRCNNCRSLYHAKDIRMPIICYYCTGDHAPQDCTVIDPTCLNCKYLDVNL